MGMTLPATDVVIPASGATLAGSLWRPGAEALLGTVIMVHGSGPADRHNDTLFPPIRRTFLDHGLAVLSYDKRGVGGSSGDWRWATLLDLAQDALAAAEVLKADSELSELPIGFFGHSQGGWIVPLAASMSGSIDWIITNSGPGVPPWRQVLFELENQPRPWRGVPVDAHSLRLDWHWFLGYDPAPVLAQIGCPLLAVFGARDRLVPVEESIAIFEHAAAVSGNRDVTIRVFPDGDHRIQEGPNFVNGYLDLLATWAVARATNCSRRAAERKPPRR
jgi:pimeloyl-ACP methyl ester carboxylesterase